ncbi:UvrABC system protein C [Bienertia sinuspersici]
MQLANGKVVREIESPWSFDVSPLLFKAVRCRNEVDDDIDGGKDGEFVEFDDSEKLGWNRFLGLQVDFQLDKPLQRGIWVFVKGGSKWVDFEYEKLMDFCDACGLLGHGCKDCLAYVDEKLEGNYLMAITYMRPRLENEEVDHRWEEERRVCVEFREALQRSSTKAKLTFDIDLIVGSGQKRKGDGVKGGGSCEGGLGTPNIVMYNSGVLWKIERYSKALGEWNKKEFSSITSKIKKARERSWQY